MKQCVFQGSSDLVGAKMERSSSSGIAIEGSTKSILKPTEVSQPQKEQSSQGAQVAQRKLQPEWIGKFYKTSFFKRCSNHPTFRKQLNKYCIDCEAVICQYCVDPASHSSHSVLKIYRHFHRSVVPLKEITRHFDCQNIQPYGCNRQKVIALRPLPHLGSQTNPEKTCKTCKRRLIEYDIYDYCSISCKVKASKKKESDAAPPVLLLNEPKQNTEEGSSSKRINKRKGIPRRAPFF